MNWLVFKIPLLRPFNILRGANPPNFIRKAKDFHLKGRRPSETNVFVPRTAKGSSSQTCSNILRKAIISSTCQDDEEGV